VTSDDLVIMASEVGVVDVAPEKVIQKGRLQPGRMFLVDTTEGRIIADEEIKAGLAGAAPYQQWLDDGVVKLTELPERRHSRIPHDTVRRRQETFGYTHEELKIVIEPMARTGKETLGSMGTDTPVAVLSDRSRLLFDYFAQLFAQVTNPPLDAIREELVTAVGNRLGSEHNLFDPGPESCRQIVLPSPILDNDSFAKLHHIEDEGQAPGFKSVLISCLYPVAGGGEGLRASLDDIRRQASEAIADGANILILSDRHSTTDLAPIPSLLFTSAVHHHLIREKTRTRVGLIAEAGDAREVHHMCLLVGYGATAVNPYLAFETVEDLVAEGMTELRDDKKAIRNYITSCTTGILKVMSNKP
jgi:glutamate synthase (NADPH/NADH) large chain